MLHELIRVWFHWVHDWGYIGIFLLMAMESSIFPVPSEVVMPPAAYWAAQGKFNFWAVVAAGTLGSYFGSIVSYYVAQWVGTPFLHRYGKYFFITEHKLRLAEAWVRENGVIGVFYARLLPVIRHLISITAGVLRMPIGPFSATTTIGAGLWCWVLSWFGVQVLGENPALLDSPDQMIHTLKAKMAWVIAGIAVFAFLTVLVKIFQKRKVRHA